MNAYELAELIENTDEGIEESANMLRQQADRIAELEKQSEPVAWMATSKVIVLEPMEGLIPLYKHPLQTKPLSDEEIYECWEKAGWHKESCIDEDLKFARAIEAKVRREK